uniref:Uncharacterized protein n=1 Tax=Spongospora subterranea TaxID=70186 RepID=A0A0H5R134_9EUKA|eukprot:CRZ07895.1 hypothetical protein [Spongospora subterranea]
MRPSLGSAKDFIAIAELYPGRKTIAIGGPIPVVIKQESSQRPDADDLASFLSYVNAQLHPQRLIVVIDGDPSPYAAISGSWNGEDRANWVSLETASNHLQRANLRTPIAVLALIQPSKATLATVHTLFQCCSLLVTAHKVTQESCLAVLNQLVLVLLARPDADVLSISSCFRTCGTVSVYRCSQYPTVAILLRSFCSIVLSCLSFTDKTQCRRISQLLRPYCHNSEASGALVDALVDVVGFCASSASALSEVSVLQVLNEKIQTAVADLIISNHRDRWSGTFFSGLSMHYPIQALCRASEIMSRADTYIDELPRYYSYYDILPGLHQRIIDREKILKQSEQKPKQTQESIQIMALKAWEQRRNIAIATSLV